MAILLNFSINNNYKYHRFSKTLLKKSLEFVLYKKNNIIIFNSSFILLLIEVDLIIKK